jgi:hypothetical protein
MLLVLTGCHRVQGRRILGEEREERESGKGME